MRRVRSRGPSHLVAGLIALVVISIGIYFGFTKANPFAHPFLLKAVFPTSNTLRKASPVRIAGVNVGKVMKIAHVPGGREGSVVTMQIDPRGLPIHSDATVRVRPRIFLEGNLFVELQPGSPSAPTVRSGHTLPIQQASSYVQLDQILGALKSDTRHNLQLLLAEYGKAVKQGGRGYNRSIDYWKAAYESSSIVNEAALGVESHDLSSYVRDSGLVAGALDRNPEQLKGLLTDFNTTAGALARRQGSLAAAVAELPRTLRTAQPALAALNGAFPPVRALASALRPGVRSTGPMIDASLPFIAQARGLVSAPELRGLVADLRPTVPSLASLQSRSVPLSRQVRLASSCQNDVILPWTHDTVPDQAPGLQARENVYEESTKSLPGLGGESRSGDANGIFFRTLVGGGSNLYDFGNGNVATTLFPVLGVEPPLPQGPNARPPIRPNVPCETQQRPDLRTTIGPPPPRMNATLPTPTLVGAQKATVKYLRSVLRSEHLHVKVLSGWAHRSDAQRVAAAARKAGG